MMTLTLTLQKPIPLMRVRVIYRCGYGFVRGCKGQKPIGGRGMG